MRPLTVSRLLGQCAILFAILFFVVLIALKLGAVPGSLCGLGRSFLAIFVGASLSVAGCSFQALLRNPLADPYVLGVSSGAAVGAILALIGEPYLHLPPEVAALFTPVGAFLGALVTIVAVYY